ARHARHVHQPLRRLRDVNGPWPLGVEERMEAHGIVSDNDAIALQIDDCDGKAAAQPANRVVTPLLLSFEHDGRVWLGQAHAQRARELDAIEQLSVEKDGERTALYEGQ